MPRTELETFARLLMDVRDRAIASTDALATGSARGPLGRRWQEQLSSTDVGSAILELVPDIVDQVLFSLLDAIDNGRLPLAWIGGNQALPLEDLGQGEMGGLLMMGEGGWIDRFSATRFFDPLRDINR